MPRCATKDGFGQKRVWTSARDHHLLGELLTWGNNPTITDVSRLLGPPLFAWYLRPCKTDWFLNQMANKKCSQNAGNMLRTMNTQKHQTNLFLYSSAISACEKGGQWQLALHSV
eukprot:TRINITY_DN26132_c0_g1_i1.p1 TRINITY_DN26132_c0_g1~~TRINITY_DN26132_c0_g1_i1.p1  ORF type:complete len:114 (+),score=6.54 TRINITY_DN26132_c0_g1_i1:43-384(+)